jgi:hypothetical protein
LGKNLYIFKNFLSKKSNGVAHPAESRRACEAPPHENSTKRNGTIPKLNMYALYRSLQRAAGIHLKIKYTWPSNWLMKHAKKRK